MSLIEVSHHLISLLSLLFLEIVLGIDNLVFISIASSRLRQKEQAKARKVGLLLALFLRLNLLYFATWIASLSKPLLTFNNMTMSSRDLLLGFGGLFLLYKGTEEIHSEFQKINNPTVSASKHYAFVIMQIAILDVVFSFDSVMTAIGMVQSFSIMAIALTLAIIFMMVASTPISHFIEKNPTIKMLAMSFVLMVAMVLLADSFHYNIPRGYIYFSITFSLFVETMNILLKKKKNKQKRNKYNV